MAESTKMITQYNMIKSQYEDCILFFRLGDFYEMFEDDAKLASEELNLVLTSRGKKKDGETPIPMCGVPYHSCESYIARLVAKGYRVAVCEQMEEPGKGKDIVRREVIRVISPGTVIEDSMLDESRNNYLAAVVIYNNEAGICFADASTGTVHLTQIEGDDASQRIISELSRFTPSEILLCSKAYKDEELTWFIKNKLNCRMEFRGDACYDYTRLEGLLLSHFKKGSVEDIDENIKSGSPSSMALGSVMEYLYETQRAGLASINEIDFYTFAQFMNLDMSARVNLELTETMRTKEKKGSLLWVLDKTRTAMGKRLIRQWLEQPLLDYAALIRRQDAVEELCGNSIARAELIEVFSGIQDIERLMTRVVYGTANPRELKSLAYTLKKLPDIKKLLCTFNCRLLRQIDSLICPHEELSALIDDAIKDEPPVQVKEGDIIRQGYNERVDMLRHDMTDSKGIISGIEQRERERTGIKNLRVGYNKVFGYFIEVTNSYKGNVPEDYIRKQTLVNCERYVTEELKNLEGRVLGAKESLYALEYKLFSEVRGKVSEKVDEIKQTAAAVSNLDVLLSLAQVASARGYCRPQLNKNGVIKIKNGRHPVVEAILDVPFVPNDTMLDTEGNRCAIITGPNMAGKSTYMRQVALITLMAQIGSFVPADSAEIGLVDAIFTRVGASDDLSTGQSTFMVEMNEVSEILSNATSNSLLILDEIGRGTSTFDGMSIARAVLEFVADKKRIGAKTLFATHYHELTELEELIDGVKNYNVAVKKRGDDITFLRRIIKGAADDSYGIEVAKLAGIPDAVINRAKQVLKGLESGEETAARPAKTVTRDEVGPLDEAVAVNLVKEISKIDVETLTPIESMTKLFGIVSRAKKFDAGS